MVFINLIWFFCLSFLPFSWDWCYWNECDAQLEVIILSCSPLIYFLVVCLVSVSSLRPGVPLPANFLSGRVTPRDLPRVVMGLLKEMQLELWLPKAHRWNNDIYFRFLFWAKILYTWHFFHSVNSSTDVTIFFCIGG